jgi:DNA-binding MarR family transcriptional regulator
VTRTPQPAPTPTPAPAAQTGELLDTPRGTVTPDALPHHLALVCSQFSRLAARRSDVGVGSVSWRVVATIERLGPLRLSEIAERERVSRPTATTVIKRLEEEGLVRRESDPTDSRSSLVSTTEAGSAQLAAWRAQLAEGVGSLLQTLPEEDLETLSRASEILGGLLESHDR